MRIDLRCEGFTRGGFELNAIAEFSTGTHLITGSIGSGKSTLALAAGEEIQDKRIRIMKKDIKSILLSFQFPEYHLTESSVYDEIASWGLDAGEFAQKFGFWGKRQMDPVRLSRGELKRLELACMLERDPDLLILDEPFASLDCMWKEWLCNRLNRRRSGKRGITLIFSHERMHLPEADELWRMDNGRLIHIGRVPEAIPEWKSAPDYIVHALRIGAEPQNITMRAAEEAICRIQG